MNSKKLAPLSIINEGNTVIIKELNAGFGLMRRLMEMGFVTNAKVRIIKSSYNGPMIVAIDNARFAISRGIALKIFVEVI